MAMGVLPVVLAELTAACGDDPGFFCELVYKITDSEPAAEIADFLVRPARVILILVAAWLINRVVGRIIDRTIDSVLRAQEEKASEDDELAAGESSPNRLEMLRKLAAKRALRAAEQIERGRQRTETLRSVLRSTASIVIYAIATFMALGEFDVNLGPLVASAGIVGVALGFGAQSLVKDFLTGMFMLLEDQYGVGDIVDLGDASGVVEEVKLRTTKIRDVNGTLWHVPNGVISRVANMSQAWARAVLDVEVAYDTDINHAMTVIKHVADDLWEQALPNATVLEEPEVWGVESFGSDSIAIRLVLKVEPGEQWSTRREVRRRLKQAFDEEGIEIPFPQRTVWLHQAAATPAEPQSPAPIEGFPPGGAAEGEVGV